LLSQQIKDVKKFIEKIREFSLEELQNIKDIGPVVGKSIYDWFNNKRNLELLNRLNKANIKIETSKHLISNAKFQDKTFVLTGELENFTRDEIKEKIRSLGGDISGSVSKKTSFVVVGKNPGSKYNKAKKLKVKVIKEDEFLKMTK